MRRSHKAHHAHAASDSTSLSAAESRQRRAALAAHVRALDDALAQRPVNVRALRALSIRGFVHDDRRRVIWPMLLGVDVAALDRQAAAATAAAAAAAAASTAATPASAGTRLLPPAPHDYYSGVIFQHRYFDQIEKDINRSMCHFAETRSFKLKKRTEARGALSRVLHTLFSLHADLHYIQGFHDIASVFLLVCASPTDPSDPFGARSNARGEELAFHLTERLALLHIRDSLRPTLDTVVEVMSLIFPLLRVADPAVHDFLVRTNVQSFFTLSWILTWFSHNLESVGDVSRVFDFFLSSHPLMPLYSTVALIVQLRQGLLDLRPRAVREARERYKAHYGVGSAGTASSVAGGGAGMDETRAASPRTNSNSNSNPNARLSSPPSAAGPPPFDPECVEVEMSAVHEYFQHLPPVLNLDALFQRTSALYQAYPPMDLIKRGRLKIPRDSPLLLPNGAEDLPGKLTNYLEWKRLQRRPRVARADAAVAGSSAAAAAAQGAESFDRDGRPVYATAAVAAAASAASTASWLSRALQLTPFYAYPSARSSRAAMLRFAVRVSAAQLRENALARAQAALARARRARKLSRSAQRVLVASAVAVIAVLLLFVCGWLRVPPWLSVPAPGSTDRDTTPR